MGVEDPMLVVDRFRHGELLRFIKLLPQGAQLFAGKVLLDQGNQLSFARRSFLRWQQRDEWLQLLDRQHVKRLVHGGNSRGFSLAWHRESLLITRSTFTQSPYMDSPRFARAMLPESHQGYDCTHLSGVALGEALPSAP